MNFVAIFDEAGRGALAGPVFVGCIVFDKDENWQRKILRNFEKIKDSKKLSEKKRNEIFEKIPKIFQKGFFSVGSASEKEIDELGIVRAIEISCIRALEKLVIKPNFFMFDGYINLRKDFPSILQFSEPKLDETNPFCSLASILAKVSRDNFIREKFEKHDEYGFLKHVGYGTEFHRKKILELGLSDFHRKSFVLKEVQNSKDKSQKHNVLVNLLSCHDENTETHQQLNILRHAQDDVLKQQIQNGKKENRRKFGTEKEDLAEKYLLSKNYKILARNFGVRGVGELDIVAEKNDTIFFFEVRARKSKNFGKSIESVTRKKLERIKKTAEIFLQRNNLENKNREFKLIGF